MVVIMVVSMECTLRGIVFESQRQVWLPKGRSTTADRFQTIFWNFLRKPSFKSLWRFEKRKKLPEKVQWHSNVHEMGKTYFWNKHKQYMIPATSQSGQQTIGFSSPTINPPGKVTITVCLGARLVPLYSLPVCRCYGLTDLFVSGSFPVWSVL